MLEDLNRKPVEPAPDPTPFDYALTAAKAGAIAFPFLGPGITLFELIASPLRGKRFSTWCEELRLKLNIISEKVQGLTPEKLAASEEFVSALNQAVLIAIRTHDKDKFEALQNAVLHTALGADPLSDRRDVFLSLVDFLQPVHLRTAKIVASLELNEQSSLANVVGALREADAGLNSLGNEGTTLVLEDLNRFGVIRMTQWTVNGSSPFVLNEGSATTAWGQAFLAFITAPLEAGK